MRRVVQHALVPLVFAVLMVGCATGPVPEDAPVREAHCGDGTTAGQMSGGHCHEYSPKEFYDRATGL